MNEDWKEFTEQRLNKLEDITKDTSEKISELTSVVMGPPPNRTNGMQGTLKKLIEKVDKAIDWAHEIWNVKRRDECLGIAAVKKLKEEIDLMKKQQENITTAKLNLKGVYVMGVIQFIGMVLVALIAAGKI